MTDPEIEKALRQLLGADFELEGGFVVHYGSRHPARDVDLLIVDRNVISYASVLMGRLDLTLISRTGFDHLLHLLDPLVTEPVLTGELLVGQVHAWRQIGASLRDARATESAVRYLCGRAIEEWTAAKQILDATDQINHPHSPRWSMQNLAFAVSYRSFAKYYMTTRGTPTTLERLIEQKQAWTMEFWSAWNEIKAEQSPSPASASKWLNRFLAEGMLGGLS